MQKIFENWRKHLLNEVARGLDEISRVEIKERGTLIDIEIFDLDKKPVGYMTIEAWPHPVYNEHGEPLLCDNVYMIMIVHTKRDEKYGPIIYDIAMELAAEKNSYLMSGGHGESTGGVTCCGRGTAAWIWKYYYDHRTDRRDSKVFKFKIPGCSDVLASYIRDDPKYKPYIEALSHAYTKDIELLPQIRRENKLKPEEAGGRPLTICLFGKFKPPHSGHMDMLKHYIEEAESWSDSEDEDSEINIILSEKTMYLGQDKRKFLDAHSSEYIWEEYLGDEGLGYSQGINIEFGGHDGYKALFQIVEGLPKNSALLLGGGSDRIPDLQRISNSIKQKLKKENTIPGLRRALGANIKVLDPADFAPTGRRAQAISYHFRKALEKGDSIIRFLPKNSQDEATEEIIYDYLHDRWGTEKEDKPEELPPPEEVKEISLTSDGDFKIEFNNGAEAELLKYIVYVIAKWGTEIAVKFVLRWHKKIMIFLMKMHPAIFGPALLAQLFGFDVSTEEFATFVYETIAVVTEDDAKDIVSILVAIYEKDQEAAQRIMIKLIKNHIRRLQKKGCKTLPDWAEQACLSIDPTKLFENKQPINKIRILIKS